MTDLLSKFFFHVYIEKNLSYCEAIFAGWKKDLLGMCNELHIVFIKYKMEYIKIAQLVQER